jgi:hypothetical protein
MALTGHLSDLSLSELIEFFCNQRKTGQLKVLYPEGHGYFYLQTGSVVDARIGVLRGIDAVYYALTLPNARFEFGGSSDSIERTINQPWTQVVLEGLRRLDEGIIPAAAFPPDYSQDQDNDQPQPSSMENDFTELENLRVPGFLSFSGTESMGKRRFMVAGAVAVALLLSVAAIGFPAGWYNRNRTSAVVSQPEGQPASSDNAPASAVAQGTNNEVAAPAESTAPADHNEAVSAARRLREKERAKAREDSTLLNQPATSSTPSPANVVAESPKSGPKKVAVTVTYDESGRVTQASGGDASAIRIARQKRFPAGKAGSATITIPLN